MRTANTVEDLKGQVTPTIECPPPAYEANILRVFEELLDDLGLAGERRNAKLLYLALTSRLTDRPISIWVSGPSSSGKSFLVERVLKAFPESAYFARSSFSERALIYTSESFKHRFMVLYELAGMNSDFADYLLRSLLSEGRISYETVESHSGFQSKLVEKDGPTGLILTTTKKFIHPENATRMWRIEVQSDPEQTRAVLREEARQCGGYDGSQSNRTAGTPHEHGNTSPVLRYCVEIEGAQRSRYSLDEWGSLQAWLGTAEHRVVIPFASWLADNTRIAEIRLRRDFRAVLNLIKAHAILHQESRERDDTGRIIATSDDYQAVHELVSDIVGKSNKNIIPARVRAVVEAVQALETDDPVSYDQLQEELGIDRSNVSRHVREAIGLGYLINAEIRKGQPAEIRSRRDLPDESILPSPSFLKDDWKGVAPRKLAAIPQCA